MDFSLQLMVYPDGYPVIPLPASGKYARGEIVNVYQTVGPPNLAGRLCFAHVTDCPLTFQQVKDGLLDQWLDTEIRNGRGVWVADVVNFIAAYPAKYIELRDTKETLMPWADAQTYLVSKRTGNTLAVEIATGNF